MAKVNGTYYCVMIRFKSDGLVNYYNGRPAHHCYHAPNKLGAKKWKTAAGALRAMAKLPQHDNQELFVSEV